VRCCHPLALALAALTTAGHLQDSPLLPGLRYYSSAMVGNGMQGSECGDDFLFASHHAVDDFRLLPLKQGTILFCRSFVLCEKNCPGGGNRNGCLWKDTINPVELSFEHAVLLQPNKEASTCPSQDVLPKQTACMTQVKLQRRESRRVKVVPAKWSGATGVLRWPGRLT
jgi:hypothetical protein